MVLINLKQYENVGFQTQTTLKFIYKLLQIEVILRLSILLLRRYFRWESFTDT